MVLVCFTVPQQTHHSFSVRIFWLNQKYSQSRSQLVPNCFPAGMKCQRKKKLLYRALTGRNHNQKSSGAPNVPPLVFTFFLLPRLVPVLRVLPPRARGALPPRVEDDLGRLDGAPLSGQSSRAG